jgi:hypothetical protein
MKHKAGNLGVDLLLIDTGKFLFSSQEFRNDILCLKAIFTTVMA